MFVLLFDVDESVASTVFPLCLDDGVCDDFTLFGANARADIRTCMILCFSRVIRSHRILPSVRGFG